jgi:tRNA pseudouridine38-40 synthase
VTVLRLTLEYDGTKYSGWQEQVNARTVMGQLRKAAEELFEAKVDIQGSGRTDAGVHALAQIAHLRVKTSRPCHPEQIRRALNDRLPSDVCVVEVELAPPDFHARHDAISRTYLYQISTRRTAFMKKYVWWVKEDLDIAAMSRAAAMLIGRHDFAAFRALDPSRPDASTVVVVQAASLESEGHLILFRISASHYLWRMVRRIVGVLVKVGTGELKPEDLLRALDGKLGPKMDIAAWTAPASGLFLETVQYPAPKRVRKPDYVRNTRS